MNKKSILYISNIPAPYWVYGVKWLNDRVDIKYLTYDKCSDAGRPKFWDLDLPENFVVTKDRWKIFGKYIDLKIVKRIEQEKPDFVILGGFAEIVSNYFAYRYCVKNKIKCALVSEIWRDKNGRKRALLSKVIAFLFKDLNAFLAVGEHAQEYWEHYFDRSKVCLFRHPTYIDQYLAHDVRFRKNNITLFFGHRLTEEYNPVLALQILFEIQKKYSGASMIMNGSGPLRNKLEEIINIHGIRNITWTDIDKYNDLDNYYRCGDISISPCLYSNGNIGILEAAASGMPLLISENVDYHSNEIKKFENGYILKSSVIEFYDKIIKYIESDSLLTAHSQNSKKSVENLKNEKFAEIFISAIDSINKNN